MVTIESTAERRDGVTLVTATVAGGDRPTRVTLESRLDGPVWPPRRQGEPEGGWIDAGYEGVVPADGRLAIGFASPAAPVDPPLEVVGTEPVPAFTDEMDTPSAIVRGLGDPSPPALIDAGGAPDGAGGSGVESTTASAEVRESGRGLASDVAASDGETAGATDSSVAQGAGDDASATTNREDEPPVNEELPPAVAEWLADVEARLDRASGLDADASVAAATRALGACGGVAGARELDDRLDADRRRLRLLRWRAGELEERAETASVATSVLDELS